MPSSLRFFLHHRALLLRILRDFSRPRQRLLPCPLLRARRYYPPQLVPFLAAVHPLECLPDLFFASSAAALLPICDSDALRMACVRTSSALSTRTSSASPTNLMSGHSTLFNRAAVCTIAARLSPLGSMTHHESPSCTNSVTPSSLPPVALALWGHHLYSVSLSPPPCPPVVHHGHNLPDSVHFRIRVTVCGCSSASAYRFPDIQRQRQHLPRRPPHLYRSACAVHTHRDLRIPLHLHPQHNLLELQLPCCKHLCPRLSLVCLRPVVRRPALAIRKSYPHVLDLAEVHQRCAFFFAHL